MILPGIACWIETLIQACEKNSPWGAFVLVLIASLVLAGVMIYNLWAICATTVYVVAGIVNTFLETSVGAQIYPGLLVHIAFWGALTVVALITIARTRRT